MAATAKTLLVVDDEPRVCRFLARFFEPRGFCIRSAASGHEALDALEHELPDYMLLDLGMPDLDGFEVLKRVKSRYPQLRVIIVTGRDDEEAQREAMALGAAEVITKPFGTHEQDWARAFFTNYC